MNGFGHTGSRYAAFVVAEPLRTIKRSPLRGAAHYMGVATALWLTDLLTGGAEVQTAEPLWNLCLKATSPTSNNLRCLIVRLNVFPARGEDGIISLCNAPESQTSHYTADECRSGSRNE